MVVRIWKAIGKYDGQLAATSSIYLHKNIVGIYDVITLPAFRGKGIAQAMTLAAAKRGFEFGKDYAVLSATDNAKFVYEKLGFQALKMLSVYNLKWLWTKEINFLTIPRTVIARSKATRKSKK